MIDLSTSHIRCLEEIVATGSPLEKAIPCSIGNTVAGGGLWRFFSETFPAGGVHRWNESSGWKEYWKPFIPAGLFCFGEDVFGNQLVIVPGEKIAKIWNHEDGAFVDLLLEPQEMLSVVAESGIDWIDFYGNQFLDVASKYGMVSDNLHLHWTTPMILGGSACKENLSVVERKSHLIGHAKLWHQIQNLESGSTVHIKNG